MMFQFLSAASVVCSNVNSGFCGAGQVEAAIFCSIWMRFVGQQCVLCLSDVGRVGIAFVDKVCMTLILTVFSGMFVVVLVTSFMLVVGSVLSASVV